MKKAIIFDCDGTLVDSEHLTALAYTDVIRPYGIDIAPATLHEEFIGLTNRNISKILSERYGIALPVDEVMHGFESAMSAGMREHMRVLPESVACFKALRGQHPVAVASNGNRRTVIEELKVGGYYDLIDEDLIFTANQVAHPKPAPDLFLLAARHLQADPKICVVIEDSAPGARAGFAAGMDVVGYIGLAHDPVLSEKRLRDAGCVHVINSLADLPGLVA